MCVPLQTSFTRLTLSFSPIDACLHRLRRLHFHSSPLTLTPHFSSALLFFRFPDPKVCRDMHTPSFAPVAQEIEQWRSVLGLMLYARSANTPGSYTTSCHTHAFFHLLHGSTATREAVYNACAAPTGSRAKEYHPPATCHSPHQHIPTCPHLQDLPDCLVLSLELRVSCALYNRHLTTPFHTCLLYTSPSPRD